MFTWVSYFLTSSANAEGGLRTFIRYKFTSSYWQEKKTSHVLPARLFRRSTASSTPETKKKKDLVFVTWNAGRSKRFSCTPVTFSLPMCLRRRLDTFYHFCYKIFLSIFDKHVSMKDFLVLAQHIPNVKTFMKCVWNKRGIYIKRFITYHQKLKNISGYNNL